MDHYGQFFNDLKLLESYSERKIDEIQGKALLEKQKICVFNLITDRNLEDTILSEFSKKIRLEEEKITSQEVKSKFKKLQSPQLNLEYTYKRELQLMKSYLLTLFKIYELQKDLNGEEYLKKVDDERKTIKDFKILLKNIMESSEHISQYVNELKKLQELSSNAQYEYMGLMVPSNIKLKDPISRYDLEPFLEAYKNFSSELGNFDLQLKYQDMTQDFMRSQFTPKSIFFEPKKRTYIILISNNEYESRNATLNRMTIDEKKGWYAHELSHILAYTGMSKTEMVGFTLKYGFNWLLSFIPGLKKLSYSYLRNIEGQTHEQAIRHGMGKELANGVDYYFNKSKAPAQLKERYAQVYSKYREHEVIDTASKDYFKKLK